MLALSEADQAAPDNVVIRPMTSQDVPSAMELHLDAFAGYMNARLGRRYVRAILEWFQANPRGVALVAEDQSGIIGYVIGAPLGYDGRMNRDLILPAIVSLAMRPWLLFHRDIVARVATRLRGLLSSSKPTPAAELGPWTGAEIMALVGIGVSPRARGRRLGSRLIGRFEDEARRQGARGARLSVYNHNISAHRCYESCGWRAIPAVGTNYRYYVKSLTAGGELHPSAAGSG